MRRRWHVGSTSSLISFTPTRSRSALGGSVTGQRRGSGSTSARSTNGRAVSPPPALLAGSQPNVFPLLRHRFDDAARGAHWAQASTCCPFGTQSTLETSLRSPQERPHEQLSAGRGAVATAPPVA